MSNNQLAAELSQYMPDLGEWYRIPKELLDSVIAALRDDDGAAAPVAGEPHSPHVVEALSWHQHERDDLSIDDAVDVIRNGWKRVHGRTERQMLLQIAALLVAAPSSQPAEPVAQAIDRKLEEVAASLINSFDQNDRLTPAYVSDCILTHRTLGAEPVAQTAQRCANCNHLHAPDGPFCKHGFKPVAQTESKREAFEAWSKREGALNLMLAKNEMCEDGRSPATYYWMGTEYAWRGWQAANASRRPERELTDAEIESLALEHVATLWGRLGPGGDYKQTQQFDRLRAFARALLAKAKAKESK